MPKSPATSTGPGYLPLTELILRSRISLEPKKRLAAVQWARALFLWSPVVLETMALLAGECTNHVLSRRSTSLLSLPPIYLVLCNCDTGDVGFCRSTSLSLPIDAMNI